MICLVDVPCVFDKRMRNSRFDFSGRFERMRLPLMFEDLQCTAGRRASNANTSIGNHVDNKGHADANSRQHYATNRTQRIHARQFTTSAKKMPADELPWHVASSTGGLGAGGQVDCHLAPVQMQ